jgi:non-ribosomal peptide synthetase component E (peptide arylation enzyme)
VGELNDEQIAVFAVYGEGDDLADFDHTIAEMAQELQRWRKASPYDPRTTALLLDAQRSSIKELKDLSYRLAASLRRTGVERGGVAAFKFYDQDEARAALRQYDELTGLAL